MSEYTEQEIVRREKAEKLREKNIDPLVRDLMLLQIQRK